MRGDNMASCAVAEAVRDAHLQGEGDVYAVNAECADGTYADYYFDGNEEIKLLYKCPGPTDCDTFARSYRHVADHVLNTTKCKDMKDARLDCIVLARMLASAVVSGGSVADWNPYNINGEYFPRIASGFDCRDTMYGFDKLENIGLYLIVPDDTWFERAVRCGVKTIQLRAKEAPIGEVDRMVRRCAQLSKDKGVCLIVNDHWNIAIEHGAHGVHLGQEDVQTADLESILKSKMKLGLSTHCYHELARACFIRPSYVALGPVFHTTSKDMRFKPQGLQLLKQWVQCAKLPVVGIGGIDASNIGSVVNCGVSGVAVISAVTRAEDPEAAMLNLQRAFDV
ncbi:thiamine phosphate synthase [Anaplasma centrale]|nr:thiamine phosphate synthase [Anaplasma centrale]